MQSRRIPVDSGWHVSDTDFGLTRVLNRPVTVNRLRTFAPHICFSPRFRLKMRHLLMGNLKKTKRIPPKKEVGLDPACFLPIHPYQPAAIPAVPLD